MLTMMRMWMQTKKKDNKTINVTSENTSKGPLSEICQTIDIEQYSMISKDNCINDNNDNDDNDSQNINDEVNNSDNDMSEKENCSNRNNTGDKKQQNINNGNNLNNKINITI